MKNKEKTHKLRMSKSQFAIKIIAIILAFLMLLSVCATGIYYFHYYFAA
jgi:hypothetical protein